ncbi:MAG: helix-turn-helix domain-containing protein [Burkholderiales bacterium]|nr:helix-turn-helix domain-containing protein [Burkholderiales bacterium]
MTNERQRQLARKMGAAIAHRRDLAGLTQEEVSEMLGIGNQAVSRIERGAVMPTLPRLFEFAEAFKCRIDELLLLSGDRDTDQATAMAQQIEHLHPRDRDLIVNVVRQLTEHFPKQPLGKRSRG